MCLHSVLLGDPLTAKLIALEDPGHSLRMSGAERWGYRPTSPIAPATIARVLSMIILVRTLILSHSRLPQSTFGA